MNEVWRKRHALGEGEFEEVLDAVRVMTAAARTWGGVFCRPCRRGHVAARHVSGRERPPSAARRLTPRPDLGVAHAPGFWAASSGAECQSTGLVPGMRGVDVSVAVLSDAAHRHVFNKVSIFPEGNTYAAD